MHVNDVDEIDCGIIDKINAWIGFKFNYKSSVRSKQWNTLD